MTAVIADDFIHGVLKTIADPDEAIKQLVVFAILSGGPDNITAVVVNVEDDGGEAT
ncbi:hypothetical protein ABT369_39110 [Dactylosporangium sp. NPDC000244]|uniref:hypothetical protein n=1 Tax=Dactylosporangium sp. NPDC000244 TaxID=3154365 RepID=UPI003322A4ED